MHKMMLTSGQKEMARRVEDIEGGFITRFIPPAFGPARVDEVWKRIRMKRGTPKVTFETVESTPRSEAEEAEMQRWTAVFESSREE